MANDNLKTAKNNKNDEFYTQMTDIEKELRYYRDAFKDAVILCNCDDPHYSNFWKFFHLNFQFFGLKKLITTHYDPSELTYKIEYEGGDDNDITLGDVTPLQTNGDFRSPECIELLKEATVVITNPPFSLFREYLAQLIEYDKKFLIIGNMNSSTYKDVFALIRENKLWYGPSITSGDRKFYVPDDYPLNAAGCGIDEQGKRFIRVKGIRWFTNIDNKARHEPIDLVQTYSPEKYPKYENYDAINVDKALDIPIDYEGVMGVPISFMDKYCPDQFEIVALGIVGSCEFTNNREMIILDKAGNETNKRTFNAKGTLYRKHLATDKKPPAFKDAKTGELYQSIYARILIRRKELK